MTIIYNKNTPDFYLVAGVDEENSYSRTFGHKTRNLNGDFIVISSDQKVNGAAASSYTKTFKALRRAFLILLLISAVPLSPVMLTGYIHLMINAE